MKHIRSIEKQKLKHLYHLDTYFKDGEMSVEKGTNRLFKKHDSVWEIWVDFGHDVVNSKHTTVEKGYDNLCMWPSHPH